jgi:penicillin-binding protein 1A
MRELGFIGEADYLKAKEQRLYVKRTPQGFEASAGHLAEMARQYVYQKYGEQVYVSGMKVYTTVNMAEQQAAEDGVRLGVVEYNRRRGYPGPEAQFVLPAEAEARERAVEEALGREDVNGLLPALVTAVDKTRIRARLRSGEEVELGASEVKFAQPFLSAKVPAAKRLQAGSLIRVVQLGKGKPWQLTYLPQVEAALVALSPETGAIRALVGGFDFARNQFNHVTQAWRQPGSSFKPFVYSAALERGITPATVFDDAPVSVDPAQTGGLAWDPQNYDGEMEGPMTVRNGLTKSKNLVSIRLLEATGPEFAQAHAARFGFSAERIPPYLTMAVGAGEVTPLQLVSAYAVFASGGLLPRPYFLTRITDKDGRELETFQPVQPERVLDVRNAYLMTSMMKDVVRRGTGAAAARLGRGDLAGKTGTTNDHRDTWFAGFNGRRVAVSWMGFDQPRPLGRGETGGVTALPIWMQYMAVALRGQPEATLPLPEGVAVIAVDPHTGVPVGEGGVPEFFLQEFAPGADGGSGIPGGGILNAPG